MTSTHSTHDGSRDLSGSLKHSLAYLLIKTEHRLNGRVADAEKEREREREGCVVEASITASDTCQSTAQLHAMSSAVRLSNLSQSPAGDGWLQRRLAPAISSSHQLKPTPLFTSAVNLLHRCGCSFVSVPARYCSCSSISICCVFVA